MAAHLEGKGIAALDMIGLAQKGGAVLSHLKVAPTQEKIGAPRVAAGGARLVLGCDIVVAAGPQAVPTMRKGVTAAVVNLDAATTGDFTRAPDLAFPSERLRQAIVDAAGPGRVSFVDAGRLAARLVGDTIGANLFLVGYAWQKGLLPLSREAIERAIEINGVQVDFNLQAFLWGRRAATTWRRWSERPARARPSERSPTLDEIVAHRAAFLAGYQDEAYAARYRAIVARVAEQETKRVPGRGELAEAVARNLFKLMAVKDEYEVARLWTDGSFLAQLGGEFESWDRLEVTWRRRSWPSATRPPATCASAATARGCSGRSACWPCQAAARHRVRHFRPHGRAPHGAPAAARLRGPARRAAREARSR